LRDPLPDVDGIYLGGGYPELHAEALSQNTGLLSTIRRAAADGMPIYAECGGMMYACREVITPEGVRNTMSGIFDATVEMTRNLQALSYVETVVARDTILAKRGTRIRGHEFHYSRVTPPKDAEFAYLHERGKGIVGGLDGLCANNTLASYLHLHFGSDTSLAQNFVSACAAYART
jgi:cobyrinic acid a,c-diamide synthase